MQAFNITPHYTKSLHSRAKLARCNDPALRRACGSCNEALCLAPRPGCNAIMCAGGRSTWSGLQHALMLRLWPRFAGSQVEGNNARPGITPCATAWSVCSRSASTTSTTNQQQHQPRSACGARHQPALHRMHERVSSSAVKGKAAPRTSAPLTESAARIRWQYQQNSLQCKQTAARRRIAG